MFSKKLYKKRSPEEEKRYIFNEYLKKHGIITVYPNRSIGVNGQIEYLDWNKEENVNMTKTYYHRTIKSDMGLLHMVTAQNREMKILQIGFINNVAESM